MTSETTTGTDPQPAGGRAALWRVPVAVAALGVVFGDLGTSGLYALQESFDAQTHSVAVTRANVLGVLSLVLWSLVVVVSLKYLLVVMRADNRGEGGILALTSLVIPPGGRAKGTLRVLIVLGLFGTALLYGDGMITPAMSVLSAVQGVGVVAPALSDWVVPLAVVILVALFLVQRRGSGTIGRFFGPVMIVWFATIAVLGLLQIAAHPVVLEALSPHQAVRFFANNGSEGFLVLGSVFLVLTGAEALYADMGHFGREPIRIGWFLVVLPALLLNYFGQGALVLHDPTAVANPFFNLVPDWGVVPLVVLATMATVIASQALITGVFSLTVQAVQLGYLPRIRVTHTSDQAIGQVYVPLVNWLLLAACVGLIVVFRSSANLANAYGVAVVTTMVVTTLIFYRVAQHRLGWSRRRALAVCLPLFAVDSTFFAANLPKIPHGGWFPILVGVALFVVLTTWNDGREALSTRRRELGRPIGDLREALDDPASNVARVPGTAVYLAASAGRAPTALIHNMVANDVLHERVVLVTVQTEGVPHVDPSSRSSFHDLGAGLVEVGLRYGFMDRPDVPRGLGEGEAADLRIETDRAYYFVDHDVVVPSPSGSPWTRWRTHLLALMLRNASNTADYFRLPSDQTMVLGARVEL